MQTHKYLLGENFRHKQSMTQEKITPVDPYVKPSTGQTVAGHTKRVHINTQDAAANTQKATDVKDAIGQQTTTPSGVTFLQEGETAAHEYTLADGRRVGINAETLDLRRKAAEAAKEYRANPNPETLAAKRDAAKAYKIAFAGSVRNYSLAEVHTQADIVYTMRPRNKDEQELGDLIAEARRLGDELGVTILKPIPPHEEYLRAELKEKIKTPEDAARYMLSATGQEPTEKEITKIMGQKPGWLQKRITRREIKRIKQAIEDAKNSN